MADPFTDRALQIYEDAKTQIGYVAHRFRQKVTRDGGLAAAKHWLRPPKTTAGFQRLLDHDRLDLSVEAVALQEPWSGLFTEHELETACPRLEGVGYFVRTAESITLPSEAADDERAEFEEGRRALVLARIFERNSAARKKCVEHYGYDCYVCGFNFVALYDSIGEAFIHVHHLVPFSSTALRRTDPVEHLRPVCPNCHAMLHREDPPIPIGRLKNIVAKSRRSARKGRAKPAGA